MTLVGPPERRPSPRTGRCRSPPDPAPTTGTVRSKTGVSVFPDTTLRVHQHCNLPPVPSDVTPSFPPGPPKDLVSGFSFMSPGRRPTHPPHTGPPPPVRPSWTLVHSSSGDLLRVAGSETDRGDSPPPRAGPQQRPGYSVVPPQKGVPRVSRVGRVLGGRERDVSRFGAHLGEGLDPHHTPTCGRSGGTGARVTHVGLSSPLHTSYESHRRGVSSMNLAELRTHFS